MNQPLLLVTSKCNANWWASTMQASVKMEQPSYNQWQIISQYSIQNLLIIIILPCSPSIKATANKRKHQGDTLLPKNNIQHHHNHIQSILQLRRHSSNIGTSSVKLRWNRFRKFCIVRIPPLKHGNPESWYSHKKKSFSKNPIIYVQATIKTLKR